jgi:hypothetical protein
MRFDWELGLSLLETEEIEAGETQGVKLLTLSSYPIADTPRRQQFPL